MKNVWLANASSTPPTKPASLEVGFPKDEGPATVPGAWWYHMVTTELNNAIIDGGLTPDENSNNLNQLSRAIAEIAKKTVQSGSASPVRLVDTVGVPLSFSQVIDGATPVTGDRILRAVNPPNASNGIYTVNTSGTWVRSDDFPAGSVMKEGTLISVAEGNNNRGTIWQMSDLPNGDAATIGQTAIAFRNVSDSLNARFANYLTIAGAAETYAPLTSPTFAGSLTLTAYAAGAVPYLSNNRTLVSDNSLTYDGTTLSVSTRINSGAFIPTAATIPQTGMYRPAENVVAFATAAARRLSINSQGFVAIGDVAAVMQGQITGAGQLVSALVDNGAVGASLYLQDTNAQAGAGGALVFGTQQGGALPFAAIKGLLSDPTTGRVGHIAVSVRSAANNGALSEAARFTNTRNLLVGTATDDYANSVGNIVGVGKVQGAQLVGIAAGAAGQLQAVGGANTSWYNAFLRNDGSNVQLLSSPVRTTAAAAVDAGANTFRPFAWNLTTGQVTIDQQGAGASFGGGVTAVAPANNDNSTRLVTSAWVRASTVTTSGDQTIAGAKTFSNYATFNGGLGLSGNLNLSPSSVLSTNGGSINTSNGSINAGSGALICGGGYINGGVWSILPNGWGQVSIAALNVKARSTGAPAVWAEADGSSFNHVTGVIAISSSVNAGAGFPAPGFNFIGLHSQPGLQTGVTSLIGGLTWTGAEIGIVNASDYRLKQNVARLSSSWEIVRSLRPVVFKWKRDPNSWLIPGFLAHEVKEVIPTAVIGDKDDEDDLGNIKPQMLDQSKLIPYLTNALIEAIDRIEALEIKLANR